MGETIEEKKFYKFYSPSNKEQSKLCKSRNSSSDTNRWEIVSSSKSQLCSKIHVSRSFGHSSSKGGEWWIEQRGGITFSFSSVIGCRGIVNPRFAVDDAHGMIDLEDASTQTARKRISCEVSIQFRSRRLSP